MYLAIVSKSPEIDALHKFRLIDIYATFHEVLPEALYSSLQHKELVSETLKRCCSQLIYLIETNAPHKTLKKALSECMDSLFLAPIDTPSREFGYQIGWFLAEKAGIDLTKGTERKVWGYWKIEQNQVKTIAGSRKKRVGSTKPPTG